MVTPCSPTRFPMRILYTVFPVALPGCPQAPSRFRDILRWLATLAKPASGTFASKSCLTENHADPAPSAFHVQACADLYGVSDDQRLSDLRIDSLLWAERLQSYESAPSMLSLARTPARPSFGCRADSSPNRRRGDQHVRREIYQAMDAEGPSFRTTQASQRGPAAFGPTEQGRLGEV